MINNNNDITSIDLKKSLLLFSGGLDSTTLLYWLVSEHVPVTCICFDYGQQARQELEYAKQTCEKLNVKYEIIDMKKVGIGMELGAEGNIKNSYDVIVPNRNSIFLSIATNYAIRNGCQTVYLGVKEENPAYFDASTRFIEEYNNLNMVSDMTQVEIKAPLLYYSYRDVVDLALKLDVPLTETWSCFGNEKERCGICANCRQISEFAGILVDEYKNKLDELEKYKVSHIPQNNKKTI